MSDSIELVERQILTNLAWLDPKTGKTITDYTKKSADAKGKYSFGLRMSISVADYTEPVVREVGFKRGELGYTKLDEWIIKRVRKLEKYEKAVRRLLRTGVAEDRYVDVARLEMVSGIAVAADNVYDKYDDENGKVWLVGVENPGDSIYCGKIGEDAGGFSGHTLFFELRDGSTLKLKGPWHSNSSSLFEATGIDVRDKHLTWGLVALDREAIISNSGRWGGEQFRYILYQDKDWVLGSFHRVEKIAMELAKTHNIDVIYYSQSRGGSSSGGIGPKHKPYWAKDE